MFYTRVFMVIVINLFTEVCPLTVSSALSLFVHLLIPKVFIPDVKNRNLNERRRVKMSGKIRTRGAWGEIGKSRGIKWLSSFARIHRLSELECKHIHHKCMFLLWCFSWRTLAWMMRQINRGWKLKHRYRQTPQTQDGRVVVVDKLTGMIKNTVGVP